MTNVVIEHRFKDHPDRHGDVVCVVGDFGLSVTDDGFMVLAGPGGG